MWPVNRGHFRNCVSELGSLLAVCRSNDVETTPLLEAGGALNSLNSLIQASPMDLKMMDHRAFSPPRLFSAVPMNSSHRFRLSPRIIQQILVAENYPCSSFQHSFLSCNSHPITSPNPRAVEEIIPRGKG